MAKGKSSAPAVVEPPIAPSEFDQFEAPSLRESAPVVKESSPVEAPLAYPDNDPTLPSKERIVQTGSLGKGMESIQLKPDADPVKVDAYLLMRKMVYYGMVGAWSGMIVSHFNSIISRLRKDIEYKEEKK